MTYPCWLGTGNCSRSPISSKYFYYSDCVPQQDLVPSFPDQDLDPDLPAVRDLVPSPHNIAGPGLVPSLPGGDIILALAAGPSLRLQGEGERTFPIDLIKFQRITSLEVC